MISIPGWSLVPDVVRRGYVPEDLDSVSSIAQDDEVDPRSVGVSPAAVDAVWDGVRELYRSGIHPAIQLCIRRRGEILVHRAIGHSHGAGPEDGPDSRRVKVTTDTPFNVFSASKPVIAMLIHKLDEEHRIHLDDPVCEYIPGFEKNGKKWITIRHVLTHRAGIPLVTENSMDTSVLKDTSNREVIAQLCDTYPATRAGQRQAYHTVTGGFILGEIVRRVSGRSVRRFLDETLCEPLGWRWMSYGVSARDVPRVAENYSTGVPILPPLSLVARRILGVDIEDAVKKAGSPEFLQGVVPAGNLVATAKELSGFYEMLLRGGVLDGKRVFDERTIRRATSEQSYFELDLTLGVPVRYGMGFMLGGRWLSLYGLDAEHAFGHLGFTNIVSWADPKRDISVALMTSGKPVLYPELYQFLFLLQAIADVAPQDVVDASRRGSVLPGKNAIPVAVARGRKAAAKTVDVKKGSAGRPPATVPSSDSKAAAEKAAPKKVASKKAPEKKAAVKKAAGKKAAVKKVASKKPVPKKRVSKKVVPGKTTPKKAASKKTAPKKGRR